MTTPKKLYRSTENKMFSGVCGGIANYFNFDPTILRILWVVLSFFLGFFIGGMLIYIIVAMIIPKDPGYLDV